MTQFQKQVSTTLALVMLFTSLVNTVLVMCTADTAHHAIELIGHQEQLEDHAPDTLTASESSIKHEAHPESCTDTALLAESLIQRDTQVHSWDTKAPLVIFITPLDDSVEPVTAVNSLQWPVSHHLSWLRSTTDDLSTIRLLI